MSWLAEHRPEIKSVKVPFTYDISNYVQDFLASSTPWSTNSQCLYCPFCIWNAPSHGVICESSFFQFFSDGVPWSDWCLLCSFTMIGSFPDAMISYHFTYLYIDISHFNHRLARTILPRQSVSCCSFTFHFPNCFFSFCSFCTWTCNENFGSKQCLQQCSVATPAICAQYGIRCDSWIFSEVQ